MTDPKVTVCAAAMRTSVPAIERRLCALQARIERAMRPHGYPTDMTIIRATHEEAELLVVIIKGLLAHE